MVYDVNLKPSSSPFVNNKFICSHRTPIPSLAMVTGEMRVTENTEDPCNQPVPVSAQPWESFENLRCIHATFQQLNASGTAKAHAQGQLMLCSESFKCRIQIKTNQ